jgi:hypothetical protein
MVVIVTGRPGSSPQPAVVRERVLDAGCVGWSLRASWRRRPPVRRSVGVWLARPGCAGGSPGFRSRTPRCARSSGGCGPSANGWRPNANGWAWRTSACGPSANGSSRSTSGCAARWRRCAGTIERDGWAPYRRFQHATHQTCLAQCCGAAASCWPMPIAGSQDPARGARLLEHALALRCDRDAGTLEAGQLAAEVQGLEAAVDRLVAGASRYPPNRRLLDHLAGERDHLFTFLRVPGVQATTGAPSRPSAPRWSAARPGAATVPGQAPPPGRPSPACYAPPPSKAATPSSCSLACYGHQRRSWPTSPSPGTNQHTRHLNTLERPRTSGHGGDDRMLVPRRQLPGRRADPARPASAGGGLRRVRTLAAPPGNRPPRPGASLARGQLRTGIRAVRSAATDRGWHDRPHLGRLLRRIDRHQP